MSKRCLWVAALLDLVLLTGCVLPGPVPTPNVPSTPSPQPTALPAATPDPRQGGRLTVRLTQDIPRLTPLLMADNPEAGWVTGLLYAGLTKLDDHLLPQPDLAAGWDVSPEGLEVTFTLRADLRWSDGAPLTAADVLFTFERLRSWEVRSGTQADLRDYVAAVTVPSTQTVTFVLNRRLAGVLADASFPILPLHIWGNLEPQALQEADLLSNPVGSGPFELRERRPGEALVLSPNRLYHGEAPFLSEVAFLVAPDPQVAELALRQGDLSVAVLPREAAVALEATPPHRALRLAHYLAPQYTFVAFNTHQGSLFADLRLRQAWSLALDKGAIVAAATEGEGIPLRSPILPPSWAYDAGLDAIPFAAPDLDLARQLLAEAGWQDTDGDGVAEKDGQPLAVRLFVRADNAQRVAASQRIAEALSPIGMAVQVIPADFQTVIAAKLRPPYDFDALCMQWRNLGPDPDQFYLFHSSQAWQGPTDSRENLYNFVGYRSEDADRLLLAGRDTYDLDERRLIYGQLQELLAQDLPYYYLWGDPVYIAADARLVTDGVPVNLESPNFLWNVERWYYGK